MAPDISLTKIISKKSPTPHDNKTAQAHIEQQYSRILPNDPNSPAFVQFFTDGSLDPVNHTVGCAIYSPQLKIHKRIKLNYGISIMTAEMVAIIMALNQILEIDTPYAVICTDSLSALQALRSNKKGSRPELVHEIRTLIHQTQLCGNLVQLCWIPSHTGIVGNEIADELAKESCQKIETDITVPISLSELKALIHKEIRVDWQQHWKCLARNAPAKYPMFQIQPILTNIRPSIKSRREDIVISRLRMGCARLKYLEKHTQQLPDDLCDVCQTPETIEHYMLKCAKYDIARHELQQTLSRPLEPFHLTTKNLLGPDRNHAEVFNALLKYIRHTGHLSKL